MAKWYPVMMYAPVVSQPPKHSAWRFMLTLLLLLPLAASALEQVMVTVKQTSIRADKLFYAKAIATARFTDRLQLLSEDKGWLRVKFRNKTGWVHASAVSSGGGGQDSGLGGLSSALNMLSGKSASQGSNREFSEDEVALAGKGFNVAVESEYRKQNPRANFSAVDKMEKQGAKPATILRFADAGALQPRDPSAPTGADADRANDSSGGSGGSLFDSVGGFFKGSGDTPAETE